MCFGAGYGGYFTEHQQLNFKTCKQRGEWVEMLFMARASREGLQVSKPYGDSAAYDFIVESGASCLRIQVKSTGSRFEKGFRCNLRASMSRAYKPGSFDFIAVHVIPLEVWFIIPRMIVNLVGILLTPDKQDSKYYKYQEAWHLLRTRRGADPLPRTRAKLGSRHRDRDKD
ncbi:MAG: group I intron-associated PD-(D/E)XK endonuclease [Terriglobales bacterium]